MRNRPSINLDDGDSSPGIGREDTLTLMTARSMKSGRLTHRSSTWKSGQSVVSREDKRKVLVKDFLETNGFMHVNEAKRSWGMTSYPLHAAVHQKNAAVVKALLQLGARPDVKYRGQTPEEYAQRKNQPLDCQGGFCTCGLNSFADQSEVDESRWRPQEVKDENVFLQTPRFSWRDPEIVKQHDGLQLEKSDAFLQEEDS
eukprot:g3963.t1